MAEKKAQMNAGKSREDNKPPVPIVEKPGPVLKQFNLGTPEEIKKVLPKDILEDWTGNDFLVLARVRQVDSASKRLMNVFQTFDI